MSLKDNAFLSVAETKSFLNISSGDTNLDTMIEEFINAACGMCEDITGAFFKQQFTEEILDGSGGTRLSLSKFPFLILFGSSDAEKLANIRFRYPTDGAWYNLFASLDGMSIYTEGQVANGRQFIQRVDGYCFPLGIQNVKVKYYFGYADGSIPSQVRHIALQMVQYLHQESRHGKGILGQTSESRSVQGQNSTIQLETMRKRWAEQLQPFTREKKSNV